MSAAVAPLSQKLLFELALDLAAAIASLDFEALACMPIHNTETPSGDGGGPITPFQFLESLFSSEQRPSFVASLSARLSDINRQKNSANFHFRAHRLLDESLGSNSSSLIPYLLFCLQGDLAQQGLDAESLPSDPETPRRQTLDALARLGWKPTPSDFSRVMERATEEMDFHAIVWVAEQSQLALDSFQSVKNQFKPIAFIFSKESDQALSALARLVELNAIVDAPESIGISDFLFHGQFKCAQLLADREFSPRPLAIHSSLTLAAADALAHGVCRLDSNRSPLIERLGPQAVAMIHWLADKGAPFSSSNPEWRPLDSSPPDPLAVIANQHFQHPALLEPALTAFAQRGADPNQSGLFLANALSAMRSPDGDPALFNLALSLGARSQTHPAALLAAPFNWEGSVKASERSAWLDKLVALGANPADCSVLCPSREHPVARAIQGPASALPHAWRLIEQGASTQWRDSEGGDSLLHLIAERHDSASDEFLSRLLALPDALALINAPNLPGVTPLIMACSTGRASKAKILLDNGADPNLCDSDGQSALHHAAGLENRATQVVDALLAFNPDLSLISHAGFTPAQLMAIQGPFEAAALLLELRPQDLSGSSARVMEARDALMEQGPKGLALVERCDLTQSALVSSRRQRRSL